MVGMDQRDPLRSGDKSAKGTKTEFGLCMDDIQVQIDDLFRQEGRKDIACPIIPDETDGDAGQTMNMQCVVAFIASGV